MVADPNNHLNYWCGGKYYSGSAYVMGVSKTTNGGSSWQRHSLTTTTGFCYAIAVDPTTSNIVYAGGNGGLYKTTNGGSNWSNYTNGISGTIYAIAIDDNTPTIIYVGATGGVYKSTNGGTNWTDTGCSSVKTIVIDPNDHDLIYAGTSSGVYKSTNGGGGWTQMNQGLDNTNVTSLGLDPNNYLFCGTDGASMYRWPFTPGIAQGQEVGGVSVFARPNPMRARTTIGYSLTEPGQVAVSIYDAQGRLVRTLINRFQEAGNHSASWYGRDHQGRAVSAGIYFCRLKTDDANRVEKLILLR